MPDVFVAPEELQEKPFVKKEPPKRRPIEPAAEEAKKQKLSAFTSFCFQPEGISFEHQEKDEDVVLFLRRHFLTNLSWIITTIVFAILPLLGVFFLSFSGTDLLLPQSYVVIITFFYYLIIFGYALIHFVIWFYNVGIITRLRVIDIDVSHITARNVAATGISGIVDIEYMQKGLLSSFFDYGDVHIQTEGLKANFEFHKIPHPAKVADTISDLIGGREPNE